MTASFLTTNSAAGEKATLTSNGGGSSARAIATQVTARIADALRNGVRPWQQPWSNATALSLPLRANGVAYRGINILVLWAAALERGYQSRQWMSFAQARELGGAVRRGEKATRVIFYSGAPTEPNERGDAADAEPKRRAFLKSFAVFNTDQIENLPVQFCAGPTHVAGSDDARLATAFARVPATVHVGGARACYNPATDAIHMPPRAAFSSTSQYYATLAHECAHWTGHTTRLQRQLSGPGNLVSYAAEELVAELCSAFLGAELGLPVDHLECHASYIDHWLKLLDREPNTLVTAAGKAQAAADYLRAFLFSSSSEQAVDV